MKNDNRKVIFLIGSGRSGTKFLRSCLSASKEIDSIPYDVGYIWRYGSEQKSHDELSPSDLNQRSVNWIRGQIPTQTSTLKHSAKFILEKSVPNSLRVEYLNAIYPDAKFIHLIRNGNAVIESSIRQWREPIKNKYLFDKIRTFPWRNYRYAFWFVKKIIRARFLGIPSIWGPRYKGIELDLETKTVEEICAKQWSRCVDLADSQLSLLDSSRVIRITFEDLMSDNNALLNLCSFIGLSDPEVVLKKFESDVLRGNNEKSISSLTPEAISAIEKYAKKSLIRLGYL